MVTPVAPAWDVNVQPSWKLTVAGAAVRETGHQVTAEQYDNDHELAQACATGVSGAFDALVERHRRTVYQLCYRFVGNHEDASDLAQEVLLRAHRGLKSFKGDSALSTWLYRIGVNVCLSHVNSRAARMSTEPLEPERFVDERTERPEDRIERAEQAARVRAAIRRLPEKQRATVLLRLYHELSHQEIAAILGNSVGAVKANLFHALANLKKLLESD